MSDIPDLRHPKRDWQRAVLFVLTLAGVGYAVVDKVFNAGRSVVTADRAERIENTQAQQSIDIVRAKMQAEGANAAALRVEAKVDNQDRKLDHINDVLMQIRLTGRR